MRFFALLLVVLVLHSLAAGALSVTLSDQGTGVKSISSGTLLTTGNLTVLIYEALSGGDPIYNETFNAIVNGSWNVVLGGGSTALNLEFGRDYYKDYAINGEDATFANASGDPVDRQLFFSPLGDVGSTVLLRSDSTALGDYNATHVNFGINSTTGTLADNTITYATVCGGNFNRATGNYDTIAGGIQNVAQGGYGAVGGGAYNNASDLYAVISGGDNNLAQGEASSVAGGRLNVVTADLSSVGGGFANRATGAGSTVAGGYQSTATGLYSAIGGGLSNNASNTHAAIAGGEGNNATATYTFIGSGYQNVVNGSYGVVGGGYRNSAKGSWATVSGGTQNNASKDSSTVGGGDRNHASGTAATISGGALNLANGSYSAIGGGGSNAAGGYSSSIGGGLSNAARSDYSSIGGGAYNNASNSYATVAGGDSNIASGARSFVGGGLTNTASGEGSSVGGGSGNTASGINGPSVGGGYSNTASGASASVAAGYQNIARGDYSFVGGGYGNDAYGNYAAISGGASNNASGIYAAASGGSSNRARGDYSLVGGLLMELTASADRSFLWGYNTSMVSFDDADSFIVFDSNFQVRNSTKGYSLVVNRTTGNVGIGTAAAGERLSVYGRINASGSITGNSGLDYAERFPASSHLSAGDVVVIDTQLEESVHQSSRPYDTTVAGVVSTEAAFMIGSGGTPIALAGRVPVKVTDENGAIATGDLLTTSSVPGHAMRCDISTQEGKLRCFGAVLGKAMEPCAARRCVITALVSLQ